MLGRQYPVSAQVQAGSVQLDLSKLPSGLYIVSLEGEQGRYIGKVVVE